MTNQDQNQDLATLLEQIAADVRKGEDPSTYQLVDKYNEITMDAKSWVQILNVIAAGVHMVRRKPRTITINGRTLNAPETEAPEVDTEYWVPCPSLKGTIVFYWKESPTDYIRLRNGCVFLCKTDAQAVAEALSDVLLGK